MHLVARTRPDDPDHSRMPWELAAVDDLIDLWGRPGATYARIEPEHVVCRVGDSSVRLDRADLAKHMAISDVALRDYVWSFFSHAGS